MIPAASAVPSPAFSFSSLTKALEPDRAMVPRFETSSVLVMPKPFRLVERRKRAEELEGRMRDSNATHFQQACTPVLLFYYFHIPSLPPFLPVSRSVKVPFSSSVVMVISRGNEGSAIAASPDTGGRKEIRRRGRLNVPEG
jgi:hypothetical protein